MQRVGLGSVVLREPSEVTRTLNRSVRIPISKCRKALARKFGDGENSFYIRTVHVSHIILLSVNATPRG